MPLCRPPCRSQAHTAYGGVGLGGSGASREYLREWVCLVKMGLFGNLLLVYCGLGGRLASCGDNGHRRGRHGEEQGCIGPISLQTAKGLLCSPEVLVKEDLFPAYDQGQNLSSHCGQIVVVQRLFNFHKGVQAAPAALVGRGVGTSGGRACPPALCCGGDLLRLPAVTLLPQAVFCLAGRPGDTKALIATTGVKTSGTLGLRSLQQ